MYCEKLAHLTPSLYRASYSLLGMVDVLPEQAREGRFPDVHDEHVHGLGSSIGPAHGGHRHGT